MSELFKAVQETLRANKARGIDLTNPIGVEVFGKLYPATEKGIMVHEHFDGFQNHHNTAFYAIPIENGLKVQGWNSGLGDREFVHHRLFQPSTNLVEEHPATRYGWTLADVENDRHSVNFDENGISLPEHQEGFHETMKKWSNEPTHGFTHRNSTSITPMSNEEHREHRHNVRSGLLKHPHKIVVLHRNPLASHQYYEYDLRTEELKPHNFNEQRSA